MRVRPTAYAAIALVLAVIACRKKEIMPPPPSEDIPREIALSNLKTLLPNATEVYCTLPKDTLKQSEIREWVVGNDGFTIVPHKAKPLSLNYADILQTRLEKSGTKFYVKLFTSVQREPNREHFYFVWMTEESAKAADQIFTSLKKK